MKFIEAVKPRMAKRAKKPAASERGLKRLFEPGLRWYFIVTLAFISANIWLPGSFWLFAAELAILAGLFISSTVSASRRKDNLRRYINGMTENMQTSTRDSLIKAKTMYTTGLLSSRITVSYPISRSKS